MSPFTGLRVVLVGPLPPPNGGMAMQTLQLEALLTQEGARVTLVQANRPAAGWIERVRFLRAGFRWGPYARSLRRALRGADVVHLMANSGWAWHLVAAPAVWLAWSCRVPVILNYRGGLAAEFLARASALVMPTLARVRRIVVPSGYLQGVFAEYGMASDVVANIVDVERFRPRPRARTPDRPRILVARNLEAIYDIGSALRALAIVRLRIPGASLTVAGSGPELPALIALRDSLGLTDAVNFCGRLDREAMVAALGEADLALNPSRVDNMPNSVLEAMACELPIVSTRVGGIPFVLTDERNGLLVPAGDVEAMAGAILRLAGDPALAARLAAAAHRDVQQYSWPRVRAAWADVYTAALCRTGATMPGERAA